MQIDRVFHEVESLFFSDPHKALKMLQSLLEVLDLEHPEERRETEFKIAQIKGQLGEYPESESILLRLLKHYEGESNIKWVAKLSNEMGNNKWAQGNLPDALEYYLESLDLLEGAGEFHNMCIPLNNIGQIYWYQQEFDKAEKSYNRALELAEEFAPQLRGDSLINLGILSGERENFKQAESYYNRALKVYKENNNLLNVATVYVNLALMYEDTNQMESALEYHTKAIGTFKSVGKPYGQMHAQMNLAGYLIKQEKMEEATKELEKALELAQELNAKNQICQIYTYYRDLYQKKGDFEKAYEFLLKYHESEMDRLAVENQEKLNEALTRYETKQKEKEAELLKKQNDLLSEKNEMIELQKSQLDLANQKLRKANVKLEKRLEELLEKWHEQEVISRAEEHLGGFREIVSSIAHQWKQPINIIGLLIQNLVDAYQYAELNEQYFERFQNQIFQQLKYMTDTVNDFAYEMNKNRNSKTFSLKHALELAASLIKKSLEIEQANMTIEQDKDFPITGSESKFIQVLMVILSNTLEIFQAEKQDHPQIIVSVTPRENQLKIAIYNTGTHIPEEVLPRIFDAFFSTKGDKQNSGLGLTLARKIISDKFDGDITCENSVGGVTFEISLPYDGHSPTD